MNQVCPKGEGFIFYSDGLPEAASKADNLLGNEAIELELKKQGNKDIGVLANIIWDLYERFTINALPNDDITLFVLRYFGSN